MGFGDGPTSIKNKREYKVITTELRFERQFNKATIATFRLQKQTWPKSKYHPRFAFYFESAYGGKGSW